MTIIHYLARAHPPSCSAPEKPCSCTKQERDRQEEQQYWATSILAIIGGIIGALAGYGFSMAVLSDSLHAFSDGFADMWGVRVMRKVRKDHTQEKELRRKGTRVIASFLAVAALLVLHEAYTRWNGNGYTVSPVLILLVGLATSGIDLTRVGILSLAQSNNPNEMRAGLILHALLDLRRSELLVVMGVLMYLGKLIAEMLFISHVDSSLRGIDLIISVVLAIYMLKIARMMWFGNHSHKQFALNFERWLMRKLLGIIIPLPEQHCGHHHKVKEHNHHHH